MAVRGAAACTLILIFTAQSFDAQGRPASGQAASAAPADDGWRPARSARRTPPPTAPAALTAIPPASVDRSTRVAAQSPDSDLDESPGPVGFPGETPAAQQPIWSYPSRRASSSVPVPSYGGDLDQDRVRLALNPVRRSTGTRRAPRAMYQNQGEPNYSQGDSVPIQQSPPYQPPRFPTPSNRAPAYAPNGSPPDLPSFHPTPFDSPAYSAPAAAPAAPCAPCQPAPFEDACAELYRGYSYTWDSIYFFALFDAFRLDHDSTRAGGRFGFNWGLPVIDDDSGLGVQLGLAGSAVEEGPQYFATTGLFYRGDMRAGSAWNAGAVFDWMHDEEISSRIGQVRGMASVTLNQNNEIGVWGAGSAIDDDDSRGHKAESVNQINLFYRYLFDAGDVSVWAGWRSEPESAAVGGSWYAPINDYWAGVVGGYYAFQGDTWNVYSGFVRHWGNRARQDYIGQDRHLPYLPVADNSTMTLFHKP